MLQNHRPDQGLVPKHTGEQLSAQSPEFHAERAVSFQYGAEVEAEMGLIATVLPAVAAELGVSLHEGDFDAFCRQRLAKREYHKTQEPDEDFEQLRLLNMLYEKAIACLQYVAEPSAEQSEEDCSAQLAKAKAIIKHLMETLDMKGGGNISSELLRLYDYMLYTIDDEKISDLAIRAKNVVVPLDKIYQSYLEIELRAHAEAYFQNHPKG